MALVFGWIVVAVGVALAVYAFVAAIWWSIHPGELEEDHPKRMIFKEHR
jgi:hypothetical protein